MGGRRVTSVAKLVQPPVDFYDKRLILLLSKSANYSTTPNMLKVSNKLYINIFKYCFKLLTTDKQVSQLQL